MQFVTIWMFFLKKILTTFLFAFVYWTMVGHLMLMSNVKSVEDHCVKVCRFWYLNSTMTLLCYFDQTVTPAEDNWNFLSQRKKLFLDVFFMLIFSQETFLKFSSMLVFCLVLLTLTDCFFSDQVFLKCMHQNQRILTYLFMIAHLALRKIIYSGPQKLLRHFKMYECHWIR